MSEKIFVTVVRLSGDLAGVFEDDGETCYFYLCKQSLHGGHRVIGAIHVLSGRPDFVENDVEIHWSTDEQAVGLLVRGQIWAVFTGEEKYGGNYQSGGIADIPESITALFAPSGSKI